MMALDVLLGMSVFRQAAELGSLAASARAHGLSPEMAGRHLRALEGRIGVRLLNRSTRRLAPTEAGRAYLARCAGILDEIADAEAEAGARGREPRGRLRVAAPLLFGRTVLAPVVEGFLDRWPLVSLELTLGEALVDVSGGAFDLALRLGALPDSALIARRIAAFPLLPVAAPAYLARQGTPAAPDELGRHEALIYTETATPRRWAFSDGNGARRTVEVEGRVGASDVGFLLELALSGRGVLLAPSFAVAPPLADNRLVRLLPDWNARTLPLHVLLPHRGLLPAATRCLVEFLADKLGTSRAGKGPEPAGG
ncbi:LysR family transcriptional regulator [Rhizosaccharibacter radicis]|uniref:LysR family transcriptional regulator n=1 Tax=Rhizosaccharibacter radicis TaxID=2782605 RepID=A0ABT1VSP7_9PROT|nr:LysR family transcriptional regulator [Acetobacteraceae bacterium KSS12]